MRAPENRNDEFTRSAYKLRDRMLRSKSGWGEAHLRKLYEAFGFVGRDVGDHVCYYHPRFPQIRGQVPRHRHLRDYVVADALDAVDELLRLCGEESHEEES
jgi:hypothetical protein